MKEHKEAPVLQPESRRSNLHTSNFDPLHGRIEWEMKGKYLMALNIYTSINIPGQERRWMDEAMHFGYSICCIAVS